MNPNISFPRGSRWRKRGLRAAIGAVVAAALVVAPVVAAPAYAKLDDAAPAADASTGANTEVTFIGYGVGIRSDGYLPATTGVPNPQNPYPADPPDGYPQEWVDKPVFAGTRQIRSVSDPSVIAEAYCIELPAGIRSGLGYESGSWSESNIPNLGYVTYILNAYYPSVDAPAGLTRQEKAAAVQAAIWYFTDGFVLSDTHPTVRSATAAIVAGAQHNGPVMEPMAPGLEITPAATSAAAGSVAGPFVVTAEGDPDVTVSVPAGYTMYRDEAATITLGNSATVSSGTSVWVTGPSVTDVETVLTARAVVPVQAGTAYVYDGNTEGLDYAQPLILAKRTELEVSTSATAEYFAAGAVEIAKTVRGDAAGSQSEIEIGVMCDSGLDETFTIPAGAAAGEYTQTYEPIPAGSECVVTELASGATAEVEVATSDPVTVTIGPSETADVELTNIVAYRPGALALTKTVTGEAAGSQSEIEIGVMCDSGLDEIFTIPAGAQAGDYDRTYEPIPAGSECVITELASGSTTEVDVLPSEPVNVTIAPAQTAEVRLTNTVVFSTGSLDLVKVIAGGGAGSQDEVSVTIMCTSGRQESFVIPAGSPAGEYMHSYTDLPAWDECTVTESATGSNSVVEVTPDAPVTVEILPHAGVEVRLTNTVAFRPGELNVVKVIDGAGAGLQSAISLWVTCDNGLAETFAIPAGSAAGEYSRTFGGLPAGTECLVAERERGANDSVVIAADDPVTVTIAPGAVTDARLTNTVLRSQTVTGGALALSGGDAPMPLLAVGAGVLGLGAALVVAFRANRRETE